MLTDKEIKAYYEEGLVVSDCRLPEDILSRLSQAVDKLIADHPDIRPELLSGPYNPYGQSAQLMAMSIFSSFASTLIFSIWSNR